MLQLQSSAQRAPSVPVPSSRTVGVLRSLKNLTGSAPSSARTALQAERLPTPRVSALVRPNLPHTAVLSPISVKVGTPSLYFLSLLSTLNYHNIVMSAGLARVSTRHKQTAPAGACDPSQLPSSQPQALTLKLPLQ